MYHLGTENPWACDYKFNAAIDFCIWVLQVDGLQVSPFDMHASGDGTLQAAGLDAHAWRMWIQEVVNLHYHRAEAIRKPSLKFLNEWGQTRQAEVKELLKNPTPETLRRQAEALGESYKAALARGDIVSPNFGQAQMPPAVWSGNAVVGNRLAELWEHYKPLSHKRMEWERERVHQWFQGRDRTARRLWHDLEPYHNRLEALYIHFVDYPQEVNYLVLPVSVVMTIVNGQFDATRFRTRALEAAEALSASSSSGQ